MQARKQDSSLRDNMVNRNKPRADTNNRSIKKDFNTTIDILQNSLGKISNMPEEMKNFNREMEPIKKTQREISKNGKHISIKNSFDDLISRLDTREERTTNNKKEHRHYPK